MTVDGAWLLGLAAVVTAVGVIVIQVATLITARATSSKVDATSSKVDATSSKVDAVNVKAEEIHLQTNSNASNMDARLAEALELVKALGIQLTTERDAATAATLAGSEREVELAKAATPPKEG